MTLTEAQLDALDDLWVRGDWDGLRSVIEDQAARLARLEALADEWERKADNAIAHDQMMRAGRLTHAARRLRAALAAAPSREADQ